MQTKSRTYRSEGTQQNQKILNGYKAIIIQITHTRNLALCRVLIPGRALSTNDLVEET
jgi:hypothetical protein